MESLDVLYNILRVFLVWLTIEDGQLPKLPTPEQQKLIEMLDSDSWEEREKAEKELSKNTECLLTISRTKTSLEVKYRLNRLVFPCLNIDEDVDNLPSIWSLPEEWRFPFGYEYTPDMTPKSGTEFYGGRGWCTELVTGLDVSEYYFDLARSINNSNKLPTDRQYIRVNCWLNYSLEKKAMELYLKDMLLFGKTRTDLFKVTRRCKRLVNSHINMYRHFGTDAENVIPGPLLRKEEFPQNSYWRRPEAIVQVEQPHRLFILWRFLTKNGQNIRFD